MLGIREECRGLPMFGEGEPPPPPPPAPRRCIGSPVQDELPAVLGWRAHGRRVRHQPRPRRVSRWLRRVRGWDQVPEGEELLGPRVMHAAQARGCPGGRRARHSGAGVLTRARVRSANVFRKLGARPLRPAAALTEWIGRRRLGTIGEKASRWPCARARPLYAAFCFLQDHQQGRQVSACCSRQRANSLGRARAPRPMPARIRLCLPFAFLFPTCVRVHFVRKAGRRGLGLPPGDPDATRAGECVGCRGHRKGRAIKLSQAM
ncbi:unnamed protein product [Scytosiphon promiscuus]